MTEYELGFNDALNEVMRMFDKEHVRYQDLWKGEGNLAEMERSENKLKTLNEVICQLAQMRYFGKDK